MQLKTRLIAINKKLLVLGILLSYLGSISAQELQGPESDALLAPKIEYSDKLLPAIELIIPRLKLKSASRSPLVNLSPNQANDARTLATINKDAQKLIHASAIAVASTNLGLEVVALSAQNANQLVSKQLELAPIKQLIVPVDSEVVVQALVRPKTTTTTIARPALTVARLSSTSTTVRPVARAASTSTTTVLRSAYVKDPVPSPAAIRAKALEAINYAQAQSSTLVDAPLVQQIQSPTTSLPSLSQTVFGQLGIPVEIGLKGRGWLYLGSVGQPNAVAFLEKTAGFDAEKFRFRNEKTGMVSLQFQRQDLQSGLTEKAVVVLTISPRSNSAVLPINSSIQNPTTGMQQQQNSPATSATGSFEPEYPLVSAAAGNSQNRAGSNWNQTGPRSELGANSPETSAAQANLSVESTSALDAMKVTGDAESMFSMAASWEKGKNAVPARDLYKRILKEQTAYEKTDQVMFALAKLLENDAVVRDLQASRDLYVQLQNLYPYSSLVEPARERMRYLQRTFFRQ